LAADVLSTLQRLDALPAAYNILEVSADLRERQEACLRERVPDLTGLITWLDAPPASMHGVILANEVLDALPVERFVRRGKNIMQQRVAHGQAGFEFVENAASSRLASAVQAIEDEVRAEFSDGFVSEVCLAVPDWIAGLSSALDTGVVLLFDYGVSRQEYYAAERSDGWLRCHFRHHAHNDPLVLPGIQDLTAWVDFTAVAEPRCRASQNCPSRNRSNCRGRLKHLPCPEKWASTSSAWRCKREPSQRHPVSAWLTGRMCYERQVCRTR
jgi:SAM-dependent MidA family methyltransferase